MFACCSLTVLPPAVHSQTGFTGAGAALLSYKYTTFADVDDMVKDRAFRVKVGVPVASWWCGSAFHASGSPCVHRWLPVQRKAKPNRPLGWCRCHDWLGCSACGCVGFEFCALCFVFCALCLRPCASSPVLLLTSSCHIAAACVVVVLPPLPCVYYPTLPPSLSLLHHQRSHNWVCSADPPWV